MSSMIEKEMKKRKIHLCMSLPQPCPDSASLMLSGCRSLPSQDDGKVFTGPVRAPQFLEPSVCCLLEAAP